MTFLPTKEQYCYLQTVINLYFLQAVLKLAWLVDYWLETSQNLSANVSCCRPITSWIPFFSLIIIVEWQLAANQLSSQSTVVWLGWIGALARIQRDSLHMLNIVKGNLLKKKFFWCKASLILAIHVWISGFKMVESRLADISKTGTEAESRAKSGRFTKSDRSRSVYQTRSFNGINRSRVKCQDGS